MLCCCALAGTRACKSCNGYDYYDFPYTKTAIEYTRDYRILELEKEVEELKNKLNKILEEE